MKPALSLARALGVVGLLLLAVAPASAWQAAPQPKKETGPKEVTFSYKCAYLRASEAQETLEKHLGVAPGAKGEPNFSVASDARTNTLLLRGTADRVAKARELLARIDTKAAARPGGSSPPQVHKVPAGNAQVIAEVLQQRYKADPGVRITAVGPHAIVAHASPETQLAIARHIQPSPNPAIVEVIPLSGGEPERLAETLRRMFGEGRAGAPFLEAGQERNALIVRATREQLDEIKAAVRKLTEATPHGATIRIVTLDMGSASILAEAVGRMLTQMRGNPVRVVLPGEKAPAKPAAPPKDGAKQPGKNTAPVTLTALGNRLIAVSEDPEALSLVMELVRLIRTGHGDDFEIIRLRHASAAAVARLLEEAFNGPRRGEGFGPGGSFGKGAARGERIRVVVDPETNSLLLKATPLDVLTIRKLLERALDVEPPDQIPPARTRIITLKHARAQELAEVVRSVYAAERPKGAPAPPAQRLSIGVDPRTNSLVIRCSPVLEVEITMLVEQLDRKGADK